MNKINFKDYDYVYFWRIARYTDLFPHPLSLILVKTICTNDIFEWLDFDGIIPQLLIHPVKFVQKYFFKMRSQINV